MKVLGRVFVGLLLFGSASAARSADAYKTFTEMAAKEREGEAFRVIVRDVRETRDGQGAGEASNRLLVLAIHGGRIEPGTSEAAKQVAGDASNLYALEGLLTDDSDGWNRSLRLHVSSSGFDDPRALTLAAKSQLCLSLHGFARDNDSTSASIACVGGLNEPARDAVARALNQSELGIQVEVPCRRYEGRDPMNIVNRCLNHGVQIEMSILLRDRLLREPRLLERFRDAVLKALRTTQVH